MLLCTWVSSLARACAFCFCVGQATRGEGRGRSNDTHAYAEPCTTRTQHMYLRATLEAVWPHTQPAMPSGHKASKISTLWWSGELPLRLPPMRRVTRLLQPLADRIQPRGRENGEADNRAEQTAEFIRPCLDGLQANKLACTACCFIFDSRQVHPLRFRQVPCFGEINPLSQHLSARRQYHRFSPPHGGGTSKQNAKVQSRTHAIPIPYKLRHKQLGQATLLTELGSRARAHDRRTPESPSFCHVATVRLTTRPRPASHVRTSRIATLPHPCSAGAGIQTTSLVQMSKFGVFFLASPKTR